MLPTEIAALGNPKARIGLHSLASLGVFMVEAGST